MNQGIINKNTVTINKFLRDKQADSKQKLTISKYKTNLNQFAISLNKDKAEATQEDIKSLVIKIQNSELAEETKNRKKLHIRIFYTWLNKPELVSFIKIKTRESNYKLPEDMLTQDEVMAMIQAGDVQDKAFISLLYESGMRAGEIRFIQLKHVKFDDEKATITIPQGKTGARRIMVVDSVPYLKAWIGSKNVNPERYLFVTKDNKNRPWNSTVMNQRIKRLAYLAKIKKRIYPHLFRHSRATFLAGLVSEQILKQYLGWVKDSNMASVYVHLSGKDTDSAMMSKVYNIANSNEVKKEIEEYKLKPRTCEYCNTSNEATSIFCVKCSKPLTKEARIEYEYNKDKDIEDLRAAFIQLVHDLAKDRPDVKPNMTKILNKIEK